MTRIQTVTVAGFALAAVSSTACAGYTITQSAGAAPTYSTTLNFDEVAGPTGVIAGNEWAGIGLANVFAGAGSAFVGDLTALEGHAWPLGTGNSMRGDFGIFMEFLVGELGWAPTAVAFGFTLQRMEAGLFAPVVGLLSFNMT